MTARNSEAREKPAARKPGANKSGSKAVAPKVGIKNRLREKKPSKKPSDAVKKSATKVAPKKTSGATKKSATKKPATTKKHRNPFFVAHNHRIDECGKPPAIDNTSGYTGYFENMYGEQS